MITPDTIPASVNPGTFPARSLADRRRPIRKTDIIKVHALEFLQVMYGSSNTNQCNSRLTWDRDVSKTEILIVDKYTFNLDDVQVRPAIVANRGPLAWNKSSGFRQMQERDLMTDRRVYTDLVEGVVTLSCFSREGLEAEELAADVFEWFTAFQDAIRERESFREALDRVGIFRISSVSIGEEALVKSDSAPDLSVVPVMIRALAQHRWMLIPSAGKLKNVTFRLFRNGAPA